jgi:hypothetical protein
MYFTDRNFNKLLEKVGSEGEEHNLIVSLRFSITECVRGSYNQGFMGQVGEVVSGEVNKLFMRKKLYNLRMRDGDSVAEHLNAFNTVVSQLVSVEIKI